jgi:hypothetical protein
MRTVFRGFTPGLARALAGSALALACLLTISQAQALTRDQARAKGLAWLVEAQAGDGSWVDASGTQATSTAIVGEALALSGVNRGYVAGADTSWLFNGAMPSNDSLARAIIALARGGQDVSALVQQLRAARTVGAPAGQYAAWGAYPGYAATAIDSALAYEAFTAANDSEAGYTSSVLSAMKQPDGGWAYGNRTPANSSLGPTAEVLRALGQYIVATPSAKASADSAVSAGVAWLLAHRKNDGGFAEDADVTGSNDLTKPSQVMETALVWSAFWTLQQAGFTSAMAANVTAAMGSAETFLLNQQRTDGSWGKDPLATAMVMRAWATSTLTDSNHTGVPDVVQAVLTSDYNVTDVRTLPKGNGNPVPAVVAANNVQPDSGDVPTLPEWGAILMAGLLLLTVLRAERKRHQ